MPDSDTFFAIVDAYNGTIPIDNSALDGFLSFPSNTTQSLPSLEFTLGTGTGNMTFFIPPSRYIVPKELYPSLNVTNADVDNGALVKTWIASGGPGEFMMGQKWLENVYTAYDCMFFFCCFYMFVRMADVPVSLSLFSVKWKTIVSPFMFLRCPGKNTDSFFIFLSFPGIGFAHLAN